MAIETGSPEPGVWMLDEKGDEILKREAIFVAFARIHQQQAALAEYRQQFDAGVLRTEIEKVMQAAADDLVKQLAEWGWYVER